ncbi:transporter substrate-binding domain-containing protein [sulfur-oxidizing endosymbiont of Gigantopelta aegis]|uniref:transporter substrate-binding domain-containing protein n=1 Tax=sulfur-oxidizing endosymbiont of Gigantopelta aegis TaxID=2794934 RepID=UPI0018DEC307|nr:transporter substrate-binding domain-containing protein [sulfur-oxidizing endosymbiont of Gigantopelta aegis]
MITAPFGPFGFSPQILKKSLTLFLSLALLLVLVFNLISCSDEQSSAKKQSTPDTAQESSQNTVIHIDVDKSINKTDAIRPHSQTNYKQTINKDDWAAIKASGSLRIIVPYSFQHNDFLPRRTFSYNNELKSIIRFAEENKLTPILISTKRFSNMLPLLKEGRGDIVVANLTITNKRRELVSFTIPVDQSIEQLVVAQSFKKKLSLTTLDGLKIGVRKDTSFKDTLNTLIEEGEQAIEIVILDDRISIDEKFNILNSGKVDAVIEDSNRLELFKEYRNDIKSVLDLGKERPIAWAVRKNNPNFLKQLNRFIRTEKLLQYLPEKRLGDLDSIKKHRQLRLITRNNASSYFLWKNQLMGFEYDLLKEFAKQQKINLKVLVANDFKQMAQWLEEGYGDIVSAGLIITPERKKLPIKFTNPYLFVQEIIVQRKNNKTIDNIQQLNSRTFYVRKSSSYWDTLAQLQNQLKTENIHFNIELAPENMETEEIIKRVLDGEYDLTLADSNIIAIEKSWNSELQASLALTSERGHRWLLRKNDSELLAALNRFIKKEYKKLFYNVTYNKYFKNSRKLFDVKKREQNNQTISIYDDLIKSLAKEYNFDWRLIAAQVNKESKFNPKAKSWAGAKGLLQVMPRTAREVGIKDLDKAENGLRAGLKYMDWLNSQISDELPADVQFWFILSAYNAGLGHLKDARILAKQQGLNPNRWFGNVEQAFLMLSKPKYHKKARYGYVRGTEPVAYVKKIQALYELYSKKHPDTSN